MAHLSFLLFRRRHAKNKSSLLLNFLGLTLGISCFLFTLLFVFYERSYDSANRQRDRICRLVTTVHSGGNDSKEALAFGFMSVQLRKQFPDIERIVRFDAYDGRTALRWKPTDALVPVEKLYYSDPDVFAVFTYPLLAGDTATCLKDPGCIVLTDKLATRLFGSWTRTGSGAGAGSQSGADGPAGSGVGGPANALGRTITLNGKLLKVTGVMKDLPGNSDLRFDGLISGATSKDWQQDTGNWFYTYILFKNAAASRSFQPKLDTFMKKTINPQLGADGSVSLDCYLQPLTTLHFSPYLERDTPKGNPVYVNIFLVTGLLILLIAFTNSINLTIVESFSRVMDVTIRKIYGAGKGRLILQHVGGSLFIGGVATSLSFLLVALFLPAFAAVVNRSMALSDLFNWNMLLAALAGLVLLGAGGAIYTGAYLNKVQLADSLRSRNMKVRGLRFIPRLMLGFQCFISIGMLIAAISVYRQVSFFRSTPLGFNPTNVMIVELPQNADDSLEELRARQNAVYLRQTLDRDPDVQMTSLCGSTALPGSEADLDVMDYTERNRKVEKVVYHIDVDANYFPLLQIPLLQGEPFRDAGSRTGGSQPISRRDEDDNSPAPRPALATTAFIRMAGWDRTIGQTFMQDGKPARVVGIVPDFHFGSLHHALQPLMVFQETKAADDMLVRVSTAGTSAVLRRLQALWKKVYPELPFYYSFLDEHLLQQYHDEYNLLSLLLTLTLLMIAISCIGLVAYVSFLLRMARVDIAIRRVIGASFGNIYALYIRQFVVLLAIGFAVAAPLTWWLADGWLRQFAYHISPRPVDAVIALTVMGVLVALIVLRYSWGSIRINPARVLRED